MDMLIAWLIIAASLGLYFLPWLCAWSRTHHQTKAIFVLNLLVGWTMIGWVAAMVWAWTAVRKEAPAPVADPA